MRTFHLLHRPPGLLALAVVFLLAGCDSLTGSHQQAVPEPSQQDAAGAELAAMGNYLTRELSLSAVQGDSVGAYLRRQQHRRHDPGFVWGLAADLQARLTAEQKQRLFDLAGRLDERGGHGLHRLLMGGFGLGNHGWRLDAPGGPSRSGLLAGLLTEEQQRAVATIRARYEAAFQTAFTARRDGSLDDAALRARLQELHRAMRAEIEALLTDEQRATLEALREAHRAEMEAWFEANREAVAAALAAERAAMFAALDLTDAQQTAVIAVLDEHQAQIEALRDQLRAGTLTPADAADAFIALRASARSALEALLDARQIEIVRIHDALRVVRPMFAGADDGGNGRPGGTNTGGNGNHGSRPGGGGNGNGGSSGGRR